MKKRFSFIDKILEKSPRKDLAKLTARCLQIYLTFFKLLEGNIAWNVLKSYISLQQLLDTNPEDYFEGQRSANHTYFSEHVSGCLHFADWREAKTIFDGSIKFHHDFLCFCIF